MGYHPRDVQRPRPTLRITSIPTLIFVFAIASVLTIWASTTTLISTHHTPTVHNVPMNSQDILARCVSLKTAPGPPQAFDSREVSDRYEPGTSAFFIKNAIIFTGEKNGSEVIHGSILMDKGIIKSIGKVPKHLLEIASHAIVVDAKGAWVTPGLVDLHSHLGVLSAPIMAGSNDLNSVHGPILPWLRSIDGFNTHDESFQLSIAGGVTSAQVLPGSGNAIGGQAFMIKLRKTSEGSPSSMVIEPPHSLTGKKTEDHVRWRHLKQACGENLRHYGTRMDSAWAFRSAYDEARKVKLAQDAFCAKAEAGLWDNIGSDFPESLQWEALVDVLRGRVKISNHCYEAVDLDNIVRLSNEFEFPIASFHHASEAWLVPGLLKKTWGGTPGVAMFATNHRYKREAYRGSEFAPRVLADEGIPVIMKSDHPVINSRYLLYEAQQAHYFSLPANLSLASVTSTPATIAGLSHRIGFLREGADADVVIWDSHPLRLGATPVKVWIDGILQIPVPSKTGQPSNIEVGKGKSDDGWKKAPEVPNWDEERKKALDWDGLPPLLEKSQEDRIVFSNVKSVWRRELDGNVRVEFNAATDKEIGAVVVENGQIICMGSCLTSSGAMKVVDLRGGSIAPGLMTYGSPLGLEEITAEPSTGDGIPYDAFARNVPSILDDTGGIVRAMDALMFGTRDALTAYRSGITLATSSLSKAYYLDGTPGHIISGLSTTFRTGSLHALERGAIVQDMTALHVHIGRAHPLIGKGVSVSTQIAALRRLLFGWETKDKETGYWFKQAAEGVVPLVIDVHSADIMATLLIVKIEVEDRIGSRMRMVFSGATEAHLLAKEIGEADVGVILRPSRPYPVTWDQRQILPGPPLTNDTALVKLLQHGVTVGLGVQESWEARNGRFDIQWAVLESNGKVSQREMRAVAYTNLPKLLGVREVENDKSIMGDMVAYEGGGAFDFSSKVVAIISPERQLVDLL
ncbi:hypothetical protein H2248_006514 [Termitomyces sp. 'cryptogamus']|nr:hypothetical protein H2248_006514 [Termitomyces sp. 'cryptogamus']